MLSGGRQLRPMSLGDLLDEAISLYRQNFALFAGIVAVLTVPETIVSLLLNLGRSGASTSGAVLFASSLSSFLSVAAGILILSALSYAVSRRYLNLPVSIAEAYRSVGLHQFVYLLIASILFGLAVLFGLIFFLVPGVFLAVRWSMITSAIVLEKIDLGAGFSRSYSLTKGSFWRLFGIGSVVVILLGIVGAILFGVVTFIFSIVGSSSSIVPVAGGIIGVLLQPLLLGIQVLLYYDLRVRNEGFDLEMMAQQMDAYTGA